MFGIVDDILIAEFNDMGRDHDATLDKVLRICNQANVKLNKDKCLFWCISTPFFGEVVSWSEVTYLSKFSPMTAEVCNPRKAHMSEDRFGMEWHVPEIIQQNQ